MPGTTHMQHAQPLLLSHWLLAHGEAFQRDAERLRAAAASADSCPLGSGALAGCAFPLDRKALARDLGFSRITANSLDAVSDRDFALEFLFALATLAMHLSRLSEDMVLFASPEFGFVELPDEYSTGSSLMPQKKNPDCVGTDSRKNGPHLRLACSPLLTTCKGLPSSYQRDLQEDKEPLFAAHDQVLAMVADRRRLRSRPRDSTKRGSAKPRRIRRSWPPKWRIILSLLVFHFAKRTKSWAKCCARRNRKGNRSAKCRSTRLQAVFASVRPRIKHGADARIGARPPRRRGRHRTGSRSRRARRFQRRRLAKLEENP